MVARFLENMGVARPLESRVERLLALARILQIDGVSRGILGPNEAPRVLTRHVLESCGLFPFINSSGPIVDVGSGAGLPGLPLACLSSERVLLLDAQERRIAFVRSAINRLELKNVAARQARAEEAGRGPLRETAGTVVARALATPAVALELCLPLAAIGGRVVLSATEHRLGTAEPRAALSEVAALLGGAEPEYEELPVPAVSGGDSADDLDGPAAGAGFSVANESRLVVVVPKVVPTADRYPRRSGVPARRPLG